MNYTSGATSATVSPDGKQIAFIARGEVFVTSADYATTKQITHTPANESSLSFAPDNRTLAYASERNGNWQLYLAKIARKEEPNFPNATLIKEEALLPSATVERTCPQFSPDGKELAFIEDRIRLMVLNLTRRKYAGLPTVPPGTVQMANSVMPGHRTANGLPSNLSATDTIRIPT